MTDKRIDCGTCGRKARGPWALHATTDAHRRNSAPKVARMRASQVRRETRGTFIIGGSAWDRDDGRDWDAEQAREDGTE